MGKWFITDGAAGRLCVIPDGPLLGNRLAYGGVIYRTVECGGLLDALRVLHEFESLLVIKGGEKA